MRSSLLRMRSSILRMRSSLVVRASASDCQCTSCNGTGFDPSIRRHSGIWGAADEAVLNIVWKKWKNLPRKYLKKKIKIFGRQKSRFGGGSASRSAMTQNAVPDWHGNQCGSATLLILLSPTNLRHSMCVALNLGSFETPLMKTEFERLAARQPMDTLSMKRYELPTPPPGKMTDVQVLKSMRKKNIFWRDKVGR